MTKSQNYKFLFGICQSDTAAVGDKRHIFDSDAEPSGNIYKGEKIGYAEYKIGEKSVACVDLVADRDVTVQKKKTNKKYGLIKKLKKILLKL